MYLLKIGSIPLPKLYVVESGSKEAAKCRDLGVPYIIKPKGWSDEKLVKAVLYHTLVRKFPHIQWRKFLDIGYGSLQVNYPQKIHVESMPRINPGIDTCGFSDGNMDVSDDYRSTDGGLDPSDEADEKTFEKCSIDRYIGDIGFYVNAEELQALHLLPKFMDDIAAAIKSNIADTIWMDGYNKKLGAPIGYYQGSNEAPNLIVLDTSGSIPSGVASTMVSLIETLRNQANADLIITSGRSLYWKAHDPLPSPDKLSYYIGGCNECRQFYSILKKHVLGKHWGNVIVFGDNDAPNDRRFEKYSSSWLDESDYRSTRIDRIMAFHTYSKRMPGYGLWAETAAPKAEVVYNNDWVKYMKG